MKIAPKIYFRCIGLLVACAPLAASAVIPPPVEPLYVGNFQTIEIDAINGSGNSSLFTYPAYTVAALAFNGSGQLFGVLGNNTVYQYDSQGNGTLFANTGLNDVNAMTFDGGGNLYVANLGGGAGQGYIEKYTSQGVGSVFAMTGTYQPTGGLAVDNSGNLFVSEEGNGTIVKYDSHGNGTFFTALSSYAMAYYNNYLYVATPTDAIYKVDPLGHATLFANTDLNLPESMAFDPNGNLFVVNGANGTIAEFNQQGNGSIFATEGYLMNAIAIVPEPTTWGILALGAGLIIAKRRIFASRI